MSQENPTEPKGFYQQTTSQLHHQLEALRRRREVLQRESLKPPIMRFGLSSTSTFRSQSHGSRSPVPPQPRDERQSSRSAPPTGRSMERSRASRSRQPTPPPAPKLPMRFSLSYRPSPVASAHHPAAIRGSISPTPREVNTSDAVNAKKASRSARRLSSFPPPEPSKKPSVSPPTSRRRVEDGDESNTEFQQTHVVISEYTEVEVTDVHNYTDLNMNLASAIPSLPSPDVMSRQETEKATPHRLDSNPFALPMSFSPAASHTTNTPHRMSTIPEFDTPLPVQRLSTYLQLPLPSLPAAAPPATVEEARQKSRSTVSRRSPTPTKDDLINSVCVASAEKRHCGCNRPLPISESAVRSTADGTRAASPQPQPAFGEEQTHLTARHRCPGRPSPKSISSKVEEAAAVSAPPYSPSPWPTTENIVNSIVASGKPQRQDYKETDEEEGLLPHSSNSSSDEFEEDTERAPSPHFTPKHVISSVQASIDKPYRHPAEPRVYDSSTSTAASPMPTENEIAASVLVTVMSNKNGRSACPTPASMDTDASNNRWHSAGGLDDSGSPQPTSDRLLESLEVTAQRPGGRCAEPAPARSQRAESNTASRMYHTPSPMPTQDHVEASVLASADKRTNRRLDSGNEEREEESPRSNGSDFASPNFTREDIANSLNVVQSHTEDGAGQQRSVAQNPVRNTSDLIESVSPDVSLAHVAEVAHNLNEEEVAALENRSKAPFRHRSEEEEEEEAQEEPVGRKSYHPTLMSDVSPLSDTPPEEEEEEELDETFSNVASMVSQTSSSLASLPKEDSPESAVTDPFLIHPGALADATVPNTTGTAQMSDLGMPSEVFKDCLSAPETPSAPHLPPQFFQLQRDVKAISEGRSRARSSMTSHSLPPCHPVEVICGLAVNQKPEETPSITEEDAKRRSSMMLADGNDTVPYATVIQEPHLPIPTPPRHAPLVSIPRTAATPPPSSRPASTPPPSDKTADKATSMQTMMVPDSDPASIAPVLTSPLPRPVTISSQLHHDMPTRAGTSSRERVAAIATEEPTTTTVPPLPFPDASKLPQSLSPKEGRSTPYPRGLYATGGLQAADEEYPELAEEPTTDTLTVTISPQGNAILGVIHTAAKRPREDEDFATTETKRAASFTTPLRVVNEAKPSSSSSTRGRRSTVEKLLEMLPADVVEEVRTINSGSLEDTPTRISSQMSSDLSECRSSISERVAQRPRKVYYDYNYYLKYLDELARSSAQKDRKTAGKRMQQKIMKDIAKSQAAESIASSTDTKGSGYDNTVEGSSPQTATDGASSITSPSRHSVRVATELSAELQAAIFDTPNTKGKAKAHPAAKEAKGKDNNTAKHIGDLKKKKKAKMLLMKQQQQKTSPPSQLPGQKKTKKALTLSPKMANNRMLKKKINKKKK